MKSSKLNLTKVRYRHSAVASQIAKRFPAPGSPAGGVDYYGLPALVELLAEVPERHDVVTLLFLDAFLDTAAHEGPLCKLPPLGVGFLINSYNIISCPEANLSHKHPQVLLGLVKPWPPKTVSRLRDVTTAYLCHLGRRRALRGQRASFAALLRRYAFDEGLFTLEFPPVGLQISKAVRTAYLQGITAAAIDLVDP